MPRGKRGTGPGARKRLQKALGYSTKSDAYLKLHLNREEAKLVFDSLRSHTAKLGTRESAIATNIMYRITEQVMGAD